MKNRRGFLALVAGAIPSAALLSYFGNRKGLPELKQPEFKTSEKFDRIADVAFDMDRLAQLPEKKTVEFDIENSRTVMGAYWNGPIGGQIVMGDQYYKTFKDAYWLRSSSNFPDNPNYGDCFYHTRKDKVFVWDRYGWFELREPPGGVFGDLNVGPFRSKCAKVTWIYENKGSERRIIITAIPFFLAKAARIQANLTGAKWHGMVGRKCWSCDFTRKNIEYLRQYHYYGGRNPNEQMTVFRYDELDSNLSGFH